MNRPSKKSIAAAALAVPLLVSVEGYAPGPYVDSAKVLTDCYGNTTNVAVGHIRTKAECIKLLDTRSQRIATMIDKDVPNLPVNALAATTSWTYNVGEDAYLKSTLRKDYLAGKYHDGCMQMMDWIYITIAGKRIQLPGLINRRNKEIALCVKP